MGPQDLADERQQRKTLEEVAQQLEQQLADARDKSDSQRQTLEQVLHSLPELHHLHPVAIQAVVLLYSTKAV